jgi:hypothetical protein
MLKEDLKQIFIETVQLTTKNKFDYLIYSNKGKIREPELRCLISSVLSKKKIFYGIEVPTEKKYSFSKKKIINRLMSARTDLAIYEGGKPIINIELKEGQPTIDKIEKDFEKMFLEEVIGASFFHVINGNTSKKTIPLLLDCYSRAHNNIKNKLDKSSLNILDKWFILFIFVADTKEFYCQVFDDITVIKKFLEK